MSAHVTVLLHEAVQALAIREMVFISTAPLAVAGTAVPCLLPWAGQGALYVAGPRPTGGGSGGRD